MKTETRTISELTKLEKGFEIIYRLSISEFECDERLIPSYSIYVSIKGVNDNYSDEYTVINLTSVEAVAKDFLKLITDGSVTPMTLRYVAEDYLADL